MNRKRLELLQEIGCARMSFGLEHGNRAFRETYLDRKMSNEVIVDGLKLVRDVGIPFSVNNIMGFPHETYELAFDTVRIIKEFEADDRNAYPFTPFAGTPLRKLCEDLGHIEQNQIVKSVVSDGSILDMPQFPKKRVMGLVKTFNMYVSFPESRWPEIRKAEEETDEGLKTYEKLKEEYVARFWDENSSSFEKSSEEVRVEL